MTSERPKTVAHLAGANPADFRRVGAINMPLWQDRPVYVDPRLLERCDEPELSGAAQKVYDHLAQVASTLALSDLPPEVRDAVVSSLRFPEPTQFALGTAKTCSGGHGIGQEIAEEMAQKIAVFAQYGLVNPVVLTFLAVTQPGVGGDLVSDLILNLAEEDFVRYSARVYRELGVPGVPHPKYPDCRLPVSPCNNQPVGLVPWSVVRGLTRDEIGWRDLYGDNDNLREFLNDRVRQVLGDRQRPTKADYFRALTESKDRLNEIAEAYEVAEVEPYDAVKDPDSDVLEDEVAFFIQRDGEISEPSEGDEFREHVRRTCEEFKHFVENEGALYRENRDGRIPEREVQKLFQVVARIRGDAANVDVSPETNAGAGPADFKFSKGSKWRIIVEMKISDNSKLVVGYKRQITRYTETEKAGHGIYLVVDQEDHSAKRERLERLRTDALEFANDQTPDLLWVDATPRKSASKDL